MNLKELMANASDNLSFLGVCLLIVVIVVALAKVSEKLIHIEKDTAIKTRIITVTGVFSAISAILMYFEFPLFFAPSFYKLDFSEIPILIVAFAYGPVAGVVGEFVKVVLKLFLKGTSTAFVGDFANFVVGCTMILPASIIYHIKKTRKTALYGMIAGTLTMAIIGSLFNAIYLLPAFAKLYGMPLEVIIEMGTAVNASITDVKTLALFAVFPFNILKGLIDCLATFLLYKKISPVIHAQHKK